MDNSVTRLDVNLEEVPVCTEDGVYIACRHTTRLNFPAVLCCGGGSSFYFNRKSTPFVSASKMKIFHTSSLIMFLPSNHEGYSVRTWCNKKGSTSYKRVATPRAIQALGIRDGWYKLYKTKDGGLAIKRYEPLLLDGSLMEE